MPLNASASLGLVFPGQGSQHVGMLAELAAQSALVQETFAEASAVLGYDLWTLVEHGPAEQLGLTAVTQPAILTASVALWRLWCARGGQPPALMAGHSLGEYSALVAAGVIDFKDAVPLVRFRAQAMQEAVPVGLGGMAAILGLSDDDVRAACADAAQGEVVEPVNFNAPAQVVIAGHKAAVERACDAAKAKGAKRALALPVSAPFHSSLLKPASDRLRDYLVSVTFNLPSIPLIDNVDVAVVQDPAAIKDALVRQAASPVRWVETVQKMHADGVTRVIECGPGKVLTGLVKRINGELSADCISDQASLDSILETLNS